MVTYNDTMDSHYKIIAYTDGSAITDKAAGSGIVFVNGHL